MKPILVLTLITLLTVAPVSASSAEDPMTVLQQPIDAFLTILADPQYKDETKKVEQRNALWSVVETIFDFEEISRRALARNWRDFSPTQQQEFVQVFSRILSNAYISKMQSSYQNETVEYIGREIFNGDKAMVKTKIVRESLEIPIDYYMFVKDENWKVYDITVEGVSLIRNYKTQFAKILMRKTPKVLIEQLMKKAEKQEADDSAHVRNLNVWLAVSLQGPLAHFSRPGISPATGGLTIQRSIAVP